MPNRNATAQTTPAAAYHCYRCGKDKPDSEFYHYANGNPISGCKACHADMARERRNGAAKVKTQGPALTILDDANPTPLLMEFRCEGCGKRSSTPNAEGPRGWKRVRLTGSEGEEAATLCTRCTAAVTRALDVFKAVNARRAQGKGRHH